MIPGSSVRMPSSSTSNRVEQQEEEEESSEKKLRFLLSMASSSDNQVRNSLPDRSRSKAQMCLKKIIDFIISSSSSSSALKPCEKLLNPKSNELKTERGIDIDLNLRLGPPLEELELMNKGFSACSGVGEGNKEIPGLIVAGDDCNSSVALDKSSEGECDDPKEVENSNELSRGNRKDKGIVIDEQEFSEITNLPIRSFAGEQSEMKSSDEAVVEKLQKEEQKNEGYLGLLVEAARLISGDFEEIEEQKRRVESKKSKRNQSLAMEMYEEFEDISPVVKSKRGRNQVLPFRYRDSVLDPWKRITRQRSSKDHHHQNKK